MGTLLTILIGGAVIGYAAHIILKIFKNTKAGQCSGCNECPASEKCGSRQ